MDTIHSHIPTQSVVFEPYSQKFYSYFDHNANVVKYYISPDFGEYTKIVGKNTILEGFELTNVGNTANTVYCTVGHGRSIIDATYVEIESTETITYPYANVLDETGFFVLSMRFNNQNIVRHNKVTYHLTYFTSDNVSYTGFDPSENLIILNVFLFTKDGNDISSFTEDTLQTSIVLDGKIFTIRKNTTNTMSSLIDGGLLNYDPTELPTGAFVGGTYILNLIDELKSTGVISKLTVT